MSLVISTTYKLQKNIPNIWYIPKKVVSLHPPK
jgi:hypothetical protein